MSDSMAHPSLAFSSLGRRASAPTIARLMTAALENPRLLSLAAGFTDNGSLPVAEVQAAVAELTRPACDPEFLQYGLNQGRPGLRRLLAERLAAQESGLVAGQLAEQMLVTNGSQQALYLAMQVLCDPGDIVLVDRPSYFVFLEMLSGLGVRPLSLPTQADGAFDLAALRPWLRALHASGQAARVKAVYFVSYFSNPSGRSLTEEAKAGLGAALVAEDWRLPVVEDAAYRELYFQEPWSARSVLTLPEWRDFPRLYLSTLTKSFATGLKVGFGLCTDEAWRARMLHVKGHHDFGTANFSQALLEQAIDRGGYERQLARIRPLYAAKMRALHETLQAEGLAALGWRWLAPTGGLYLWLAAPAGLDTRLESGFFRACVEGGVLYVPGDLCFGEEAPTNFARLSYGVLAEAELREAGRRFVAIARRHAR